MDSDTYHICDGWGDSVDSPSVEEMRKFLDRLSIDDPEHCEVWLSHAESGWTISCSPNGKVYLDNPGERDSAPRHLTNVSGEKMLALWQKLAAGRIEEIERENWRPGYSSEPPPPKPDPRDVHRSFWNVLIDAERRPDLKCKAEGCCDTPISMSIFCPRHHFEAISKIPCPY